MKNLKRRLLRFMGLGVPKAPLPVAPSREQRIPAEFAGLISYYKITVLNVSKSGIGVQFDEDFPLDEKVRNLGLLIDENTYVNLWVRPVWSRKCENGKVHVGFRIAESPENWTSYLEELV